MNKRFKKKKETYRIKDIKRMTFKEGETIVVNIEKDKIDANSAHVFLSNIAKEFPENKIITLIDGLTIEEYRRKLKSK